MGLVSNAIGTVSGLVHGAENVAKAGASHLFQSAVHTTNAAILGQTTPQVVASAVGKYSNIAKNQAVLRATQSANALILGQTGPQAGLGLLGKIAGNALK